MSRVAITRPVLIASCENVSERDGYPCEGRLRFEWGMSQAACDTCGGRSGVAVSAWLYVDTPVIDTGVAAPRGHEACWEEYARLEGELADAVIALRAARS